MYSDRNTTQSSTFRTVDITHKPKRKQGDNITVEVATVTQQEDSVFPKAVTLENAIRFYEENAKGEQEKLYKQTALWLRSILATRINNLNNLLNAVENSLQETDTEEEES